eukprot:jgi/Tetstr1/445389/TSEL_033175.t1
MDGGGRRGGRGGRGAGRKRPGLRPVSEDTRLNIIQVLQDFQASEQSEYSFPPTLTNDDRAVVHNECKKYGFQSRSYGKGENRRLTVFKSRKIASAAPCYLLPITDESSAAAASYFQSFPAQDEELKAASLGSDNNATASIDNPAPVVGRTGGRGRRDAGKPQAASFTEPEVAARLSSLRTRRAAPGMQGIMAKRGALPAAEFEEQVVRAAEEHQVVLIAGETGCGKTTQVPQFLVDAAWSRGRGCRIFCTQPRRISAISVADRVASERGEDVGDNVGYTIRLENRGGPQSSLMFCTNGVLLRMLTQGDNLEGVTHIIVDEIHERDRFADFLLITLKDLLPTRPDLRLILMSATLHVDLFSNYFGGCPVIDIPGFTHPVSDFYLEDILRISGHHMKLAQGSAKSAKGKGKQLPEAERHSLDEAIMGAFLHGSDDAFDALLETTGVHSMADFDEEGAAARLNYQHSSAGATPLMAAAGKGRIHEMEMLLAAGADAELRSTDGSAADDWAMRFGHAEAAELVRQHRESMNRTQEAVASAVALSKYQEVTDADEVDLQLIEQLILAVCGEAHGAEEAAAQVGDGAILVFLPGWDEIIRLKETLTASPIIGRSTYQVLLLHSMVAQAEQRKIFNIPPKGVRKIVLATNIAETAITIEDVTCVINSGRLKEKSYDPYTAVSTLQAAWISKASERQRRGRAGRCQPGVAFHMYSTLRSSNLAEYQLPELKRCPLDELCLQVKLLEGASAVSDVREFLHKAVEPPVDKAVSQAVSLLQDIGALDDDERLTRLGRHLAALPLPPKVGKMLLFAIMFGVLDPLLTVACSTAYRDPWVLPVEAGARRESQRVKFALSRESGGGSDHLALVSAFNGWMAAKAQGGSAERSFCARNFVSPSTMQMLYGMRQQLLGELKMRRLVPDVQSASSNSTNAALVRAVLACGLYPSIGRLQESKPGAKNQRPAIITRKDEKIVIHPSSVNSAIELPPPPEGMPVPCPLIAHDEVMRGDAYTYVRQSTVVLPQAMPLVAGHLWVEPDEQEEEEDAELDSSGSPTTAIIVVDGKK